MVDDDVGGVENVCDLRNIDEPCLRKKFPRELTYAMVGDPCISMDCDFFIWTSTKHNVYISPVQRSN